MKHLITGLALAAAVITSPVAAQDISGYNDLEMAHVAYTADNIDSLHVRHDGIYVLLGYISNSDTDFLVS